MIPAFALVFSEETVTLLHRQDGWTPIDTVALDDPELADRLSDLRTRAEELADGTLVTKLAIPASQILYTTVRIEEDDADASILAALEGRTPYDVAELVYDRELLDGQAHLAIVARETLHEVEGFATDHGFNPVAFTALSPENRLPEEPWFGTTMVAPRFVNGDVVERDALSLRSMATAPADLWEEPVEEAEVPPAEVEPVEIHPEPVSEDTYPDPDVAPVPEEEPAPARVTEPDAVVVDEALPDEPVHEPKSWEHPEPDAAPDLPESAADHLHEPVARHVDEPEPEPAVARYLPEPEPFEPEPELRDPEPTLPPAPPEVEPEPRPIPEQAVPAAPLPVFEHPSFTAKPTLRAERPAAPPRRPEIKSGRVAPRVTSAVNEAPFVDFASKPSGADMTPPPLRVTQRSPKPAPTARASAQRKPRMLGVVLTVLLLLALAVMAAFSSYFLDSAAPQAANAGVSSRPSTMSSMAEATPAPATLLAVALTQDMPLPAVIRTAQVPMAAADEPPAALILAQAPSTRPAAPPDPRLAQVSPRPRPALPMAATETPTSEAASVHTEAASAISDVAQMRPRLRPEDLAPTEEEIAEAVDEEGGLDASPRPLIRPEMAANAAIMPKAEDEGGTDLAVAVSQRPEMRPSGVSRASVNAALAAALEPPPAPPVRAVPAPVAAPPAPVATPRQAPPMAKAEPVPTAPSIPTRASVAQQATEQNALPLGQTNVISITGKSSNRSALVRGSNGRITRLRVGDRIDGGVVAAITENAVHYRKGNQLYALNMPG
ncbi:hypothetical protein [Falsirhodobacter sp. 20TX0035]|uniref:hypothetical protein n=1 Tax=Falsirhodobacter sp. 20TX0035 TaxID=3022019 RepID=UPI0023313E4A|nr:hypothetical protein [Falsirhodobacter sp. 20TX0035]MDB6452098.1 hypothetical protein [Falsirhodobacter sp. 20TX0035]